MKMTDIQLEADGRQWAHWRSLNLHLLNDRFPSVDAPKNASGILGWFGGSSDAAICPASWCSDDDCGPVWEFADRNHITLSVLMKHGGKPWFFRSRLADCFAIPSFDRLRLLTTSGSQTAMPLRPEPYKPLFLSTLPKQCGRFCWQGLL